MHLLMHTAASNTVSMWLTNALNNYYDLNLSVPDECIYSSPLLLCKPQLSIHWHMLLSVLLPR
jgi:hypothetical protein